MRTCPVCGAAENPLGSLRFKKYLDGLVYCERCHPSTGVVDGPLPLVGNPSAGSPPPSTGQLVVIPCPDCAGGVHRPKQKPCKGCAGLGSVRYPSNALVVYRPPSEPEPPELEILTEG